MYQYKIFQLKLQYKQDQTIIILIKLNNEMVILNFIKTFLSLGYLPIYSLKDFHFIILFQIIILFLKCELIDRIKLEKCVNLVGF